MADEATIHPAASRDWPAIRSLLESADLPIADLAADRLGEFVVAKSGPAAVLGVVGLERYGAIGLLRSLAVDVAARAQGLGARLVAELEVRAGASGIAEIWLLTNDAERFFLRHGYAFAARADAPAAIVTTEEFAGLCPASAHLMRKRLAAG